MNQLSTFNVMKQLLLLAGAILAASLSSRADIIAGPITNPTNGHVYYLLSPNSWSAAEAEAEDLGGTLAVIKNAAQNEWIYSTFGHFGGNERSLWIGLHRKDHGGPFFQVNGEPADYTNWCSGEPNDVNHIEDCAIMRCGEPLPGTWNDLDEPSRQCAVVEVANKIPVTEKERSLVGDWFVSGRADRICHITSANDVFFAINEWNGASRMLTSKKGFLFFPAWATHGELVQDKILFSNGSWWSRKPSEYQPMNAPARAYGTMVPIIN